MNFNAPTPPVAPSADAQLLGQVPTPEQEQWLLQRLKLGQNIYGQEPHVGIGKGGGAAWGLADALRSYNGYKMQTQAMDGLRQLGQQRLSARQGIFDLLRQPDSAPTSNAPDPGQEGPPSPTQMQGRAQDQQQQSTDAFSRMRRVAALAAASGDPGLEKLSSTLSQQQQQDREYAVLRQQVEHQNRQLALEERKTGDTETQQSFERGHTLRTETEWSTTPLPDQGGFMSTSKHTGETWFYQPGKAPVLVVPGTRPGSSPPGAGGGGDNLGVTEVPPPPGRPDVKTVQPPGGAQPPQSGAPGGAALQPSTFSPYLKLNEGMASTDLRVASGIKGLQDALAPGFPSNDFLKGTVEGARWRAAEHGMSQLASPDQQQRVSSWDAVVDPIIRARAGARVPEESMGRMRLELRPNPGESWDVHVNKVHRMLDTMRAEAQQLPPVKSRPYLEQLDQLEQTIPRTKAEYEAFNRRAGAQSKSYRKGGEAAPQTGPGAPLRRGKTGGKNLQQQLDEVYR